MVVHNCHSLTLGRPSQDLSEFKTTMSYLGIDSGFCVLVFVLFLIKTKALATWLLLMFEFPFPGGG